MDKLIDKDIVKVGDYGEDEKSNILCKYGNGGDDFIQFIPSINKKIYTDYSSDDIQNNELIRVLKGEIGRQMRDNILEKYAEIFKTNPLECSDGFTHSNRYEDYKNYDWLNSKLTIDAGIMFVYVVEPGSDNPDAIKNPINLFNHYKLGLTSNSNFIKKYPMTTILTGYSGISDAKVLQNTSNNFQPSGIDGDLGIFRGFRITQALIHERDKDDLEADTLSPDTMAFNISTNFSTGFMACLDWHDMKNPKLIITYMSLVSNKNLGKLLQANGENLKIQNAESLTGLLEACSESIFDLDGNYKNIFDRNKKYILDMFNNLLVPDNSAASMSPSAVSNPIGMSTVTSASAVSQEPQLKTILDNYKACCLDSIDTNTPLPSSPVFDNFLTEMNGMLPEQVREMAYTKMPFFTEQEYIDTINDCNPHEDVFSYASYGKDLLFVLKRLYASYYKDKDKDGKWQIDWADFKTQISKDVHRNEAVIFDNDEKTLLKQNPEINGEPWTEQQVLNDYYIYICNQIFNKNIKPTPIFGLLDLINICVMTVAQTFIGTYLTDFSKPETGLGFSDGPYNINSPLRYKFFLFLYGNKQNALNYNTQHNIIIYNRYQIVINTDNMDDIGLGIRLVNITMIANLNNNTAELRLIFYKSFCLYRYGVYIGDIFVDKPNNNILSANGTGIFYIYDYKTETGIYPTAKVSGTFSKGILTAGTMVDIVLYSSQEEFDNDTFKNGVDKADGVVGSLKSITPGHIQIPADINLNSVNTVYLSELVAEYNKKVKIAEITAIRKKTEDINRLVTTNKFLKPKSSLNNNNNKDSNKGMIVFQPDSKGRQYFYEGPIGVDKKPSNILYVSQQYGTIKQELKDNKTDMYISTGSPNRQNWYEFILKTRLSNYKEISDLPLQWTTYSTEFGFDMLAQSSVPGFFTKELLETIGKTTNIDNALFSDKVRLLKVLEQVYIEAIIYMSAFILMLKKYKEQETNSKLSQFVDDVLHNFTATSSEASEAKSNYEVFIDFNSKISGKYLVTELPASASEPATKDSSSNPAYDYSKTIIMPILSSMTPETSNLFKDINISTDTNTNTNTNLVKLLLILNKNIILILYMFTIITANLGDACKTLLPNYDPLVVTPMFNLFKHIYEFIIKNTDVYSNDNSNSITKMAIEYSPDLVIEHNSNEVMRLLLMLAMLFDKQKYSGNPNKRNKSGGANITMGKSSKSRRKNIVKRKWKTKNKNRNTNTNTNTNTNINKNRNTNKNININRNTKKYARVKIRKYTRRN